MRPLVAIMSLLFALLPSAAGGQNDVSLQGVRDLGRRVRP